MAEMLPEFWSSKSNDDELRHRQPARRPRQLTNISTRIHCYASYVGVLSGRFPDVVP